MQPTNEATALIVEPRVKLYSDICRRMIWNSRVDLVANGLGLSVLSYAA